MSISLEGKITAKGALLDRPAARLYATKQLKVYGSKRKAKVPWKG